MASDRKATRPVESGDTMALAPGTRLRSYEITGSLGAGRYMAPALIGAGAGWHGHGSFSARCLRNSDLLSAR